MSRKLADHARASLIALSVITLLSFAGIVVRAQVPATQSESPEVKQLKERLKQLEQAVDELKGKLTTIEDTQKTATAVKVSAENKPVQVIDAVAKDDAILQSPSAGKTAPRTAKNPDDPEPVNSFEVYGFAMLDAGYQFKSNHPDWYDTLRVTKLPGFEGEFAPDGKTYWGVRQSRFGVKSSTATRLGELKTIFEFELFGTGVDAGQTTFRLRHAYGELGQFGAGQYWTVFGDTDTFPNSFEYWGPPGLIWYRNVGFRWMPLKGRNSVTIGIERPGASADQGNYADRIELDGVKPKFDMPDITGNFRMQRDWGHVQFAGMLRKISWVDTNDEDDVDLSDTVWGYGTSITSALNFSKNDVGRFSFVYGTGIQNYFNDAPVDVGIETTAQINPLGEGTTTSIRGVTLPILGLSAFLDHRWNEKFTSAMGWSMINIENSNGQANDAFRRGHYALANIAYYPVPNVMIGSEFQWGRRENFLDGFTSNDFRIQFAFKYNFSKSIKF